MGIGADVRRGGALLLEGARELLQGEFKTVR
jgi:hypothetical protein